MVVVMVPLPGIIIGGRPVDWAAAPEAARSVKRFRICILSCLLLFFFLLLSCVFFLFRV